MLIHFDNTYARELADLVIPWQATPAPKPRLVQFNPLLAEQLGLPAEALTTADGLAVLAGNVVPAGAQPMAQAYAGHQFGGFSPRLGDGRALLLGEIIDPQGRRWDMAFKGSGRTPFSRGGDGKCALGPALREYLMSEAMAALGIPSTRTLAVVATGDWVKRERYLPGAVMTRIAASHLRVGTFQFAAAHHDLATVQALADYTIARHYPELQDSPQPYLGLLHAVVTRQAKLMAQWMGIGFIHGVMNTDNMTLSGETIDYGPCAFMEAYDPDTVFSSIDRQGRYAYRRQPDMAQWNLARFAETLLPLLHEDEETAIALATEVIMGFEPRYAAEELAVWQAKLGLATELTSSNTVIAANAANDQALVDDFLQLLYQGKLDFTLAFVALTELAQTMVAEVGAEAALSTSAIFTADATTQANCLAWQRRWQQRWDGYSPAQAAQQLAIMRHANPHYIPRNHQVEHALAAAVERNDLAPFQQLLQAIQDPFTPRITAAEFALPAPTEFTANYQTFCGT